MRKTILLSYISLMLVFAAAFFTARGNAVPTPPPSQSAEAAAVPTHSLPPANTPTPAPTPAALPTEVPLPAIAAEAPAPELIRVLHGGEVYERELESYITEVVSGEMPAAFEPEALKAQAVAARTYTLYCARGHRHADADVCTDSGCCQAWTGLDSLREKWGADYENNLARISSAVENTRGEYLVYDDAPIFAAFHSSSAGRTEACGDLWNPLPYLLSVDSPESAADVPNFVTQIELSPLDFRDTVLHECSFADFSGAESGWISSVDRDESGRVASAVLGGAEISGARLRSLFGLRSTDFDLEYTGHSFLFTVRGFGHGVGMSQYGANTMAASGADYREILAHYYPGTVLAE